MEAEPGIDTRDMESMATIREEAEELALFVICEADGAGGVFLLELLLKLLAIDDLRIALQCSLVEAAYHPFARSSIAIALVPGFSSSRAYSSASSIANNPSSSCCC